MADKRGYRLMLTTAAGEMIDEWDMDDDIDRDLFYEFAAKVESLPEFTATEIRKQLATYEI